MSFVLRNASIVVAHPEIFSESLFFLEGGGHLSCKFIYRCISSVFINKKRQIFSFIIFFFLLYINLLVSRKNIKCSKTFRCERGLHLHQPSLLDGKLYFKNHRLYFTRYQLRFKKCQLNLSFFFH